jgi:outer membrane lipoprotein-sorting protein
MAYHITLDNRPPFKLEDFAIHCNEDLKKGAALVYDGCHWRLMNLGEIAEDLPELIEELKDLKDEFVQELEEAEQKIDEAVEKVEEVAAANPEKVKFIYATMDGDNSTTVYDDFITFDSDVLYTWTS